MKGLVLFLLFIILSGGVLAKKSDREYIDSALAGLSALKDDTNKVKLLNRISSAFVYTNADSGIVFGRSALALAEKLDWKKGEVSANNCIGLNYSSGSDYKKAIEFYFAGLKINEAVNNRHLQGLLTGNIGGAYQDLGLNDKALEYHLKTLEILKEAHDQGNIAVTYGNIANVYSSLGNYRMALDYNLRSLQLNEAEGDTVAVAIVCGNIGNVYSHLENNSKALEYYLRAIDLGEKTKNKSVIAYVANSIAELFERQGNDAGALKYFLLSLQAHKVTGSKSGEAMATGNIGHLLCRQGDYFHGFHFIRKGLRISEGTGHKETIARQLQLMGSTFLALVVDTVVRTSSVNIDLPGEKYISDDTMPAGKNARLQKAIEYLERASKIEEDIRHLDGMRACYNGLASAYQLRGDYKNAVRFLNSYKAINDSVFSMDRKNKFNEMALEKEYEIALSKEQEKHEKIKKEEDTQLRMQHVYLFCSICGLLVLAGFLINVVRNSRIKRRLNEALHKITEKELTKSESNLRSIFDNSDILYLLLDSNYNVVSYNQKMQDVYVELAGHVIKTGDNLVEMLLPEKREKIKTLYAGVMSANKKIVYETAYHLPGGVRYYMVHVVPISVDGVVTGLCVSSDDITKIKELELQQEKTIQDLTQRNNDLDQFSQMVSHNVRGPLTTIMGLANLLTTPDESVGIDFFIEGIITSSRKLDTVIRDLNNILRIRNEISEVKTQVALADLIDEVRSGLSSLIQQSNAQIYCNFSFVSSIYTVKSYLSSIFHNLVSNSIKYARDGVAPEISIATMLSGNDIVIVISDNGMGIDLVKHKENIFRIYQRFDRSKEGKGLGLFMVKSQVEGLNGTISIESTPGIGTTFKIILPRPEKSELS